LHIRFLCDDKKIVVITTATTLSNEAGYKDDKNPAKNRPIGVLFKAHFHRVVVDEAHTIKNKMTKSSRACARIAATYRWCLTGMLNNCRF